jgi:hypothetical protein
MIISASFRLNSPRLENQTILYIPRSVPLHLINHEGENMALPFPKSPDEFEIASVSEIASRSAAEAKTLNWIGFAAAGTLVASGALLFAGKRHAGMVAAASGTALALLDQQETLSAWWNTLPGYIEEVQRVLGQVQNTVDQLATQREKLRRVLNH